LIEILIVISIFAVLSVLVTQSMIVTLRGSRKSEAQVKVRENVNYAFSVIERQLRSAENISTCPNDDYSTLEYISIEGVETSFSCEDEGNGYIASDSARLTSEDIQIKSCSIVCEDEGENYPSRIAISVSASTADGNADTGNITMQTEIITRNY